MVQSQQIIKNNIYMFWSLF